MNIGTTVPSNTWNQSDGTSTYLALNIGVNSSSSGNTFNLSGNGLLRGNVVGVMSVGVSGTGIFNQIGGANSYRCSDGYYQFAISKRCH